MPLQESLHVEPVRDEVANEVEPNRPACPVCGGQLIELRQKLQCSLCHTISETCCEGGRG